MNYKVKWGYLPNSQDGIYDVLGVLKQLQDCCNGICCEWEEKMWDNVHVGDWLVKVVELEPYHTVYVPYQGNGDMPEVIAITAVDKNYVSKN